MAVTTKVDSRFGQSNDARCEGMPPVWRGLETSRSVRLRSTTIKSWPSLNFARKEGFLIDEFIETTISSGRSLQREQLQNAIEGVEQRGSFSGERTVAPGTKPGPGVVM